MATGMPKNIMGNNRPRTISLAASYHSIMAVSLHVDGAGPWFASLPVLDLAPEQHAQEFQRHQPETA